MNNPQLYEGTNEHLEESPVPKQGGDHVDTQPVHEALIEAIESLQQKPFADELREIAMLLDQGELFPHEAVSQLMKVLNRKKYPITEQHLRYMGLEKFTLTHEDMDERTVFDILTKKKKEWMSIEKEDMPMEFGLTFAREEVGDEMRGKLVYDEAKGFRLHAPDHREYPLDALALAPLDGHGGAAAFVEKDIVVQVIVGDKLVMKAVV